MNGAPDDFGPPQPIFVCGPVRAIELGPADMPALQSFFESNADYFVMVTGEPPPANEAQEALHGALPAGWPYTKKWPVGFFDDAGTMLAMANVVSDLLAANVWHLGLFIVGRALRGTGVAREYYRGLESWARDCGAHWMRLGVVDTNTHAGDFWRKHGYMVLRKREGVEMGKRVNTVLVMMKPLTGGSSAQYLELVARDRPDA